MVALGVEVYPYPVQFVDKKSLKAAWCDRESVGGTPGNIVKTGKFRP